MKLPHEITRCHGIASFDRICDHRHRCLRYLTIENDLKDRKYYQSMCLCYIDHGDPYYFYYLPKDEE